MSALAFTDPVLESQAHFRAILRALALPGSRHACGEGLAPPAGLSPAAAAALLTLVDFETPWWISPTRPGADEIAGYIGFHTGAPRASGPERAAFALVGPDSDDLTLSRYAQGTPEYPDRSTTLIVETPALETGPELRVCGPGVNGVAAFAPRGLPGDFVARWAANHAAYPLGLDILFCSGARIAALPRSSRIAGDA